MDLNTVWFSLVAVLFIGFFFLEGFDYGVGRMRNLIAAWHLQLIEVMGAMGMRDARRLCGDVGRAMFFEELEEEIFGPIFGSRKNT